MTFMGKGGCLSKLFSGTQRNEENSFNLPRFQEHKAQVNSALSMCVPNMCYSWQVMSFVHNIRMRGACHAFFMVALQTTQTFRQCQTLPSDKNIY